MRVLSIVSSGGLVGVVLAGAPMEPLEWDRGPGSAYVYLAPSP